MNSLYSALESLKSSSFYNNMTLQTLIKVRDFLQLKSGSDNVFVLENQVLKD